MTDPLGYIVVEYLPASTWPNCNPHGEIHRDLADARHERHQMEMTIRTIGRHETYRIAEVRLIEDDTDDR